jgi:hypothetical protein
MNKFIFHFALFFISTSFISYFQDSESFVKVAVPTKFGNFTINKEEKIKTQSSFNNKKQTIENVREITFRVFVKVNELKITDKIKKDLSQYKNYDEDLFVILSFDKAGKMSNYSFQQESVLASFNEFYKQIMNEVQKKMTPAQAKQLLDLKTETSLKVMLTYTK